MCASKIKFVNATMETCLNIIMPVFRGKVHPKKINLCHHILTLVPNKFEFFPGVKHKRYFEDS